MYLVPQHTFNKRRNGILQKHKKSFFYYQTLIFPIVFAIREQHYVFHLSRMMYDCKLIDFAQRERLVLSKLISIAEWRDVWYEHTVWVHSFMRISFRKFISMSQTLKWNETVDSSKKKNAIAHGITREVESLLNPIRTKYCNHIESMVRKNMILSWTHHLDTQTRKWPCYSNSDIWYWHRYSSHVEPILF